MDRNQLLSLLLVLAGLVVVFTMLALGWRARRRRQAALPVPEEAPADLGVIIHEDDVLYVATTTADAPTDRIAIEGLAFRGRAYLTVATRGILLSVAGSRDVFIPVAAITGVGRAAWTIDRAVGKDGLVFVRWNLGERSVDTNLRAEHPDALVSALHQLVPTRKATS